MKPLIVFIAGLLFLATGILLCAAAREAAIGVDTIEIFAANKLTLVGEVLIGLSAFAWLRPKVD